jgi:hypothetical protein
VVELEIHKAPCPAIVNYETKVSTKHMFADDGCVSNVCGKPGDSCSTGLCI